MAAGSNCALLSVRILLSCTALAAAATVVLLPLAVRPCAHSLSRAILAATGLDPYLLSCAIGDAAAAGAPLPSHGGNDGANNTGSGGGGGGPIVTDVLSCGKPELPPHALPPFRCCPPAPASSEPVNFTFPDLAAQPLRTRLAVHGAGAGRAVAQYARAVALMKALPRSDPRSFYQQANVHCAYCAGAHRQAGTGRSPAPEQRVQIHFSWLFFPFHRAYLYFFERIAARLLGDPGFALPFWSWDVPEGMRFPEAFADEASPLHDPRRDPRHAPPTVADLEYSLVPERNLTDEQQVQHNLWVMHKQMVTNAALPSLFLGQPYRAGDAPMPGPGSLELCPHNTMHSWTGNGALFNEEDMGVYYSAGRDPVFYPYHANIDRLWEEWRRIRRGGGGGRLRRGVEFTDPDWLDASFLFYDEEARLVRVTVRDVLDMEKLRYTYGGGGDAGGRDIPWLTARPPTTPGVNRRRRRGRLASVGFPVLLDAAAVTAEVRRPGVRRSREEKEAWEEVLVVEGIEVDGGGFVKFDVYVNAAEYRRVPPGGREMAGTFVSLKRPGEEGETVKTSMRLALNELLEDLGADRDDGVTVTLVPVRGKARIGGMRIVYVAE
ncbi:hypothetical protein ACP4OV_024976 [Aristida adscensionis]